MLFGKKKNVIMLSIRCVFHYMLFNFGELGKKNYDQVEYIHFKLVFFSDSEQHFFAL